MHRDGSGLGRAEETERGEEKRGRLEGAAAAAAAIHSTSSDDSGLYQGGAGDTETGHGDRHGSGFPPAPSTGAGIGSGGGGAGTGLEEAEHTTGEGVSGDTSQTLLGHGTAHRPELTRSPCTQRLLMAAGIAVLLADAFVIAGVTVVAGINLQDGNVPELMDLFGVMDMEEPDLLFWGSLAGDVVAAAAGALLIAEGSCAPGIASRAANGCATSVADAFHRAFACCRRGGAQESEYRACGSDPSQ